MLKYSKFYDVKYGAHAKMVQLVGKNKKVLEIGCATGYISKKLKENGCQVIGIEIDSSAGRIAKRYCKNVIIADVESLKKISYKNFDVLLFGDVLEHLKDPSNVLKRFRKYLKKNGYVVLSVPNIAFWFIRLKLLFGKFEYGDYGILDRTHLKFFTLKSLKKLLDDGGYKIVKIDVTPRSMSPLINWLIYGFTKLWKSLLAYQFLIVAVKR